MYNMPENDNSNSDTVLSVSHVSKDFHLPHHKSNSIKSTIINIFKRKDKEVDIQHALRDISIDVKKGEFFGIVGRNGSGKSTLLKIIAGIYRPTKGTVKTTGKLVPFIELGVGFNPELTGKENVYLNGALLGFSRDEINAQYNAIVAFAELQDFMDQKLKNYSSGMQVRLAFSVATCAEADILLVDEVLAVGDADFQRKCFAYFKKLKKDKVTVIFVTHDMDAVREYCDRVVLINDSKVMAIGQAGKISQEYTRLFTDASDDVVGQESTRWGKGGAETVGIDVSISDDLITIRHRIVSKYTINNPIIGIRIRSASGIDVTGTNTKIEKIDTGVFKAGHERMLVWTMPAVLADGEYYIDPAIVDADGITVQDWWDEAVKFMVTKERHLPYSIDPGFNVEFSNN